MASLRRRSISAMSSYVYIEVILRNSTRYYNPMVRGIVAIVTQTKYRAHIESIARADRQGVQTVRDN